MKKYISNKLNPRSGSVPLTQTDPRSQILSLSKGFTIVELLVVIVVIGILAAITIVSYTGISQKAVVSSIQSDLGNAKKQLSLYYVENGSFPTSLDVNNCPVLNSVTDTKYCLKPSPGNAFTYTPNSAPTATSASDYSLYANKSTLYYRITSSSAISSALTMSITPCSYGFIVVPGSSTYGTSDFCVMKYNAKADDNADGIGDTNQTTGSNTWPANTYPISATRKLVSTAQGYPVANISQTTATTAASTYTNNCTGCHLITEAEYLTIAQNVLNNPTNWSSGTVGTGYIYSGHNDNAPATVLEASTNDNDGYYGTLNTTGSNQKRTLTLSNGEVIWDMAGNVWEWTTGTITAGQQPGLTGEVAFAWHQYNNGALLQNGLPASAMPAYTGISGASGWSSTQGIGRLYSNYGDASLRGFFRGGSWGNSSSAGVLALNLSNSPGGADTNIGFRVSQ